MEILQSARETADAIIATVGKNIVLGLPVGLGKAIPVANALYERARSDSSLSLSIFTGLSLARPHSRSDLEARLLEPIVERLYADWPVAAYAEAIERNCLPPNITVREFYLRPGAYLGNPLAQQNYTSINYSRVADELLALGVNVIAQLVAVEPGSPGRYSLSCNPEVSLDLLPRLEAQRQAGRPFAMVGQVNSSLPYMPGDAALDADQFDFILQDDSADHPLFGLPNRRVTAADYAIGMHVASLVPDGATLQVGIGSLSDAVAHCLWLRDTEPETFARILGLLPGGATSEVRAGLPLCADPFRDGLYACSELLSDALFSLFQRGIIRRAADNADETLVHAGFFIGSNNLYAELRALPAAQRQQIAMTRISYVNSLLGDEQRKRRQRQTSRFVNETMMATLLGAAVSDGLEDGRVVSGVGGQFDFVSMAGELDNAHSILMLRARRQNKGVVTSNIRWSYGHTTVPRQCRDIFVSEYGIAATRGATDAQVIDAMLRITDVDFQAGLLEQARRAKKVAVDYRLPAEASNNTPDSIRGIFNSAEFGPKFPAYPLGTDLTEVEQHLVLALEYLQNETATSGRKLRTVLRAMRLPIAAESLPALQRMKLGLEQGSRSFVMRKLVNHALNEVGK